MSQTEHSTGASVGMGAAAAEAQASHPPAGAGMQTPGTTASGMQTASSPQITAMPSSATTEGAQMAQSGQQRGKILIVLSSADHITLQGGKEVPTGFFMNELCTPLEKLLNNGWKVEFADPKGTMPTADPSSKSMFWYLGHPSGRDEHQKLLERMKTESNFAHPKKFSEITDEELEGYAGVFIPGGHAPVEDLHNDPDLGRILMHFHRRAKPTAAICHGPVAFLSLADKKDTTKPFAYQSYKMTAYTNTEEMVNEVSWGLHKLKIHVQSELEKHGARFQSAMIPMGSHVVVDRELVTGQNPASASALADAFLKKLDEKGGRRGSAGPAAMGKVVAVQGQPTQSMPGQTAAAV